MASSRNKQPVPLHSNKLEVLSTRIPRSFSDFKKKLLGNKGTDIQTHESSQTFSKHVIDNSVSTSMFSKAKNFTMNDPNIYNANGSIYFIQGKAPYLERSSSFQLQADDVELESELHVGKGYRLHRGKAYGRVVVVKVFEGRNAMQSLVKAAESNRGIMHPNLLSMYGKPNYDLLNRFLLFRGDYQGTVETELPLALMDGIQKTWIIGANTIIACSRALLYLENIGFPLALMGPDDFVPIVSTEGKVVINIDADASLEAANADPTAQASTVMKICSALIQKTFYASCQTFYPSQRVYEDGEEDIVNGSTTDTEEKDEEQFDRPQIKLPQDDTPSPLPKTKGHRRELIWKCPNESSWSLEEVARSYESSLRQSRAENLLIQRKGHSTARIAHRCRGYKRTEIILTPQIDQSGIVSHISPVPNEICAVCGEKVRENEQFDCQCGPLNYDSYPFRPTIQCTFCLRWQHQECENMRTDIRVKNYECWRCADRNTAPGEYYAPPLDTPPLSQATLPTDWKGYPPFATPWAGSATLPTSSGLSSDWPGYPSVATPWSAPSPLAPPYVSIPYHLSSSESPPLVPLPEFVLHTGANITGDA